MGRRKGISVLLVAAAMTAMAGCAQTQTQESAGQYFDDTAITANVKMAILEDPALKFAEINVESRKGRVQLSGFVRSQSNMDEAVAVAKGVDGVRSVRNDMRLK